MARSTSSNNKQADVLAAENFLRKYIVLQTDTDYRVCAYWAMGTHLFNPMAPARPFTYPYLYITGAKDSGKTHFGLNVLQYVCRLHKGVAQTTGATLFRMIGEYDEESGLVIPKYPTLAIDEVDAIYASGGSNDEMMRGVGNAGYKEGSTVTRSAGKTSIDFPVYCPKIWIGIDNGRLPDTLTSRCIRIDMKQATREQMNSLTELYPWNVQEEAADLQQRLRDWAIREGMVTRDYNPERGNTATTRQWEIARTLVQIAHACGTDKQMREDLAEIFGRAPERVDGKVALYRSIFTLFDKGGPAQQDRVTTNQILAQLIRDGVQVPGGNGKGLQAAMKADGLNSTVIHMREDHPGAVFDARGNFMPKQRGYHRYQFDDAFVKYLNPNYGNGNED